jgi:diphosphomevalonate decarboxylase
VSSGVATSIAHPNIAFVKYWGNRDPTLRLPCNGSLSMNLAGLSTTTTVRFDAALATDVLVIDGVERAGDELARVSSHLDLVRQQANLSVRAEVTSQNTFPMATGIAASASGFAALTLAAAAAANLRLTEQELSALARRGSGSAARSVPGGFVEWLPGHDDMSSYAVSLAGPDHWELVDVVAIVDRAPKAASSTDGHRAATASPLFAARLASLDARLSTVRQAVLERDLAGLGPELENEALSLHAIAMTGRPSLLYWAPPTLAVLHAVRRWRSEGLEAYFTLDAGPTVHVISEPDAAARVQALLRDVPGVLEVLASRPGGPARVVEEDAPGTGAAA